MKKLFLLFIILFALTVNATEIIPLHESIWGKIKRCTWHVSCYRTSFGATITTIASTDKIKDSRATINTNFTNLNTDKIEISTTTLPLITTLSNLVTTGVLSSSTFRGSIIETSYGGTGSSTLSANRVLIGNGTGGVITVAGFGTAGQGLLSNGAATAPTWQAITADQTATYSWTGTHNFNKKALFNSTLNATGTSMFTNLNASSTVVFNGVSLSFPSTGGASSTVLKTNASGTLIWDSPDWSQLGEQVLSLPNATSTVTFAARKDIRIIFDSPGASGNAVTVLTFNADYAGGGTSYSHQSFKNYVSSGSGANTTGIEIMNHATSSPVNFEITMRNSTSTRKRLNFTKTSGAVNTDVFSGTGMWNNTTDQVTTVNIFTQSVGITWNAGTRLTVYGSKD